VKFEVHGLEVLAKQVKQSGNSGRIYLPPNWVGKRVKIVRVD
jgi:putative transposon-encoded protein